MCDYHDEAEAAAGVDGDYLEVEEAVSRMEAEQAVVVVAELIEYGVERSLVGISVFPSWVGYPKQEMGLQIEAVDAADGLDSNGGHSIRHRLHHGQLDPKPSNMAEIRLKPTSRTKNGAAAVVVAETAAGGGVARHCVEMLSNVAAALPVYALLDPQMRRLVS